MKIILPPSPLPPPPPPPPDRRRRLPAPPAWNAPIENRRSDRHELDLQFTTENTFVRGIGAVGGQLGKKILVEQSLGVMEWVFSGMWAICISSNVRSIRYLQRELELWVMFGSRRGRGRIYIYDPVPQVIAENFFLNGYNGSMGKYVHHVLIPGGYTVRQITY